MKLKIYFIAIIFAILKNTNDSDHSDHGVILCHREGLAYNVRIEDERKNALTFKIETSRSIGQLR